MTTDDLVGIVTEIFPISCIPNVVVVNGNDSTVDHWNDTIFSNFTTIGCERHSFVRSGGSAIVPATTPGTVSFSYIVLGI
jgi:hypothetical protein